MAQCTVVLFLRVMALGVKHQWKDLEVNVRYLKKISSLRNAIQDLFAPFTTSDSKVTEI